MGNIGFQSVDKKLEFTPCARAYIHDMTYFSLIFPNARAHL